MHTHPCSSQHYIGSAEGDDVGRLSLDERQGIDGLFIAWDIIQL